MVGCFEAIAQSREICVAQKTASFAKPEPPRSFFTCRSATQKIRVINWRFQIEQIGQLVNIERYLSAVDVDQIGNGFKSGSSDEGAEHIGGGFIIERHNRSPSVSQRRATKVLMSSWISFTFTI